MCRSLSLDVQELVLELFHAACQWSDLKIPSVLFHRMSQLMGQPICFPQTYSTGCMAKHRGLSELLSQAHKIEFSCVKVDTKTSSRTEC